MLDAEESFETIGLVNLAQILRIGRVKLGYLDAPKSLNAAVISIEDSIAKSDEPVDELIAQFACEQTGEGLSTMLTLL